MSEKKLNLKDLKTGDVILFPPHKDDWIAQAIAFLTQSEVNHAALCYLDPGAGKLRIAESVLDGLAVRDFDASIPAEYPLRISRMKENRDMNRLMAAVKKYLDEKDKYPFFNLGMLALLLLFKKYSIHKLADKVLYNFFSVVALLLMEAVRKTYNGKHPMTCSQFVAQCFTDAGPDFDLRFDKLVVQYDDSQSSKSISLVDLMINSLKPKSGARSIAGDSLTIDLHYIQTIGVNDQPPGTPDKLTADFIALMKSPDPVSGGRSVIGAKAPDRIGDPIASIALTLYSIISGQETESLETAMNFLKNFKDSAARNYFVSPEDIYTNCPKSLDRIGLLSY
jgi:hypothetical protein